jgi:acyl-CoA ligase (AMP-forming) (exosortase A-associated)
MQTLFRQIDQTTQMLLHDLITQATLRNETAIALRHAGQSLTYGALLAGIGQYANALLQLGIARGERVAIYLEKRFENVIACFGTSAAGAVFVPVNPILKTEQVAHILRDCNVRILFTSTERLKSLGNIRAFCPDLRHILLTEPSDKTDTLFYQTLGQQGTHTAHRQIDSDIASIFYTSGSTGKPKGVVLSHRNLVAGAQSVAGYLENRSEDTLLAALPLSFDAGFSQLTTAFFCGARVVLINYLFPRDVLSAMEKEEVTGLTAVPPLYIQLAQHTWPETINQHLRYFASTGGRMPAETLRTIRTQVPNAKPFLMYGLTEAFRSTYLPPDEVDRRPDSIGKAIPNAEILVLREDGSPCDPGEPGELVHRGPLVAQGYWNDSEKTAERFKPLPGRETGLPLPEIAVFSGDTVRRDEEGFLYFVGRRDEMIKTSGYRVSPTEIEEVLYATGLVGECVAFGVPHPTIGQGINVIATPALGTNPEANTLIMECRSHLPAYMVPEKIEFKSAPLPRNPNGKLDRRLIIDNAFDSHKK